MIFTSCAAFGQAAAESPTFEVASVKPAEPQTPGLMRVQMRGGPGTPDPGQLTYTNVSLKNILTNAYGVKGYQINGPKWLDSERFDITAKIPKDATKEQFRIMLRNLLADRFKLSVHHETKELSIYALVVAKGGPKMKESVEDATAAPPTPPPGAGYGAPPELGRIKVGADGMPQLPPGMRRNGTISMIMMNGRQHMVANGAPVSVLINTLADQLGRPVVDATGLTAKYDITLDFVPESMSGPMGMMPPPPDGGPGGGAPPASAQDSSAPSIVTALQEQLGLKLEQRKGPVDLLVIDSVEKVPTEN
jgi:uncharacterized protein (TIGR03435 family)